MKKSSDLEIPLAGGRTTDGVVRIGDTVRRPVTPRSDFVRRLLVHLAEVGFEGCPRHTGVDEQGRDTLSFLPGLVPANLGEFSESQLRSAARLL